MTINSQFPTAFDSFKAVSSPGANQYYWDDGSLRNGLTNSASIITAPDSERVHSYKTDLQDAAIAAIQAKVGINSSLVTTSLDYLVKNSASVNPGHKHTVAAISGVSANNIVANTTAGPAAASSFFVDSNCLAGRGPTSNLKSITISGDFTLDGDQLALNFTPLSLSGSDYEVQLNGGPGTLTSSDLFRWNYDDRKLAIGNHADFIGAVSIGDEPNGIGPSLYLAPGSGNMRDALQIATDGAELKAFFDYAGRLKINDAGFAFEANAAEFWPNNSSATVIVGVDDGNALEVHSVSDNSVRLYISNAEINGNHLDATFNTLSINTAAAIGGALAAQTASVDTGGGGASGTRARIGGKIKDFTADVGNSTTAETDIFTFTLPANTLNATGASLSFFASLNVIGSATATSQIKAYFAGSSRYDSTAFTMASSGNVQLSINVTRTGSTTGRISVNTIAAGAVTPLVAAEVDMTGITWSNTNVIKITAQRAGTGAASNDILGKHGRIEWRPAA